MSNYVFSCGTMATLNGFELKGIEPDPQGFFPVVIGCLGMFPTRSGVIYDPDSLVKAMQDVHARFNVCLRDGNLSGEYGHPDIKGQEDIPRLLRIDEHFKSHYFGKVWLGDQITIDGQHCQPIRALVKPCGPYGDTLEKELRDPSHNTSFSIRSLCLPCGDKNGYEYRKVQVLVTFDTVHAPGFVMTSKRYVQGSESFKELGITKADLVKALTTNRGTESICMITDGDIHKLYGNKEYSVKGNKIATDIVSKRTVLGMDGNFKDAASLVY